MKKMNNKGFTLAELLIVVAIIAVLVAIAIPIFTTQLEKARESVDLANARSCYAEVMAAALTSDTSATSSSPAAYTITCTTESDGTLKVVGTGSLKQTQSGWQGSADEVGGVDVSSQTPTKGGSFTITYTESNNKCEVAFA